MNPLSAACYPTYYYNLLCELRHQVLGMVVQVTFNESKTWQVCQAQSVQDL